MLATLLKETLTQVFSCEYHNFHRKTPVLESLFTKVAGLRACKFIKKRPQSKCKNFKKSYFEEYISEALPLIFNKNLNEILHE